MENLLNSDPSHARRWNARQRRLLRPRSTRSEPERRQSCGQTRARTERRAADPAALARGPDPYPQLRSAAQAGRVQQTRRALCATGRLRPVHRCAGAVSRGSAQRQLSGCGKHAETVHLHSARPLQAGLCSIAGTQSGSVRRADQLAPDPSAEICASHNRAGPGQQQHAASLTGQRAEGIKLRLASSGAAESRASHN